MPGLRYNPGMRTSVPGQQFDLSEPAGSHRRYNPLTGRWVLVSPGRLDRPWQGAVEKPAEESVPEHDPSCYLCPGNSRASGRRNPKYKDTFVFDNDFPALSANTDGLDLKERQGRQVLNDPRTANPKSRTQYLLVPGPQPVRGICRVVCFSPRHDLSLPLMEVCAIRKVVDVLADQTQQLMSFPHIQYVQVFENRGESMGQSNPHPHCQIWATDYLPNEPALEATRQREYFDYTKGRRLLLDYLKQELKAKQRLVCHNKHFAALVPFWAIWPYETLILPRRPVTSLPELKGAERSALADILRRLTTRYDNLFQSPFPYSLGWHQVPVCRAERGWLLHAHCYPPLLRSAANRKFMVGFELLAEPQRDILPEEAAERLRAASERHYSLTRR